jgi:hypothetical protein
MRFPTRFFFASLILALGAGASAETISCRATDKHKTDHRVVMRIDGGRVTNFKYSSLAAPNAGDVRHSCEVELRRDDKSVVWSDLSEVTIAHLAQSTDSSGNPFTPKVVFLNNALYVQILMDVTFAHARFCGAGGDRADLVSFDRRSKKCGFK